MDNKYLIRQIFEKLKVPDRRIVKKFGLNKCKELDWELIKKRVYYSNINFVDILLSIDSQTEDINGALYELVKDLIKPIDYSSKMKEVYSNRLFDMSQNNDESLKQIFNDFNEGKVDLKKIIYNWDLFKNKDLSYCLLNDPANENHITDSVLKEFMSNYGDLASLIIVNNDIYMFIQNILTISSPSEKEKYVKQFTDDILSNTHRKYGYNGPLIKPTDEQYQAIFKYSSLEDYLKVFNEYDTEDIIEELKTLPQDYIFNISIPFSELLSYDVLFFIRTYGLKNIVDFDNECEHFFTKNNCKMLKLMFDMYLHYASNEHDPNKTIYTKNGYDENGNYVERLYTKDEFYEAMRRMIVYGPSDFNFADKAPDYREIKGEFRVRNADLFISEQAPEELQKLFYTKSITPNLLSEHPDYIEFLNGKDLSSCFKKRTIKVSDSNSLLEYENFYKFLSSRATFNEVMNFIIEYKDVLDILFDRKMARKLGYELKFSISDDINQILSKVNELLRKLIVESGLTYPSYIPQKLIEQYPAMFLDKDAPEELQAAFYNRSLSSDIILQNPSYIEFLKHVDFEVLFKYMPVNIKMKDSSNEKYQINFVNALKQIFGEQDSLDVMLLYGKYIEVNSLKNFLYNPEFSKDDFLDELDKAILQNIIDGNMKYDESIPSHFKKNNPSLFLDQDVSIEIRNKFYNREFTLKDFIDYPDLFDIFENTNITCAFSKNMSWIIPLFNTSENLKTANYKRMKVISAYSKIQDEKLQETFKEYIREFQTNIDIEKIDYISEVLLKILFSNSSEIFTFRKELANQILRSENPLEILNKIEDVFIKNNLPIVGKIYSCFEILHPDFQGFNFENSMISPVLKESSIVRKKIIVFSDLIKCSFGSNNRSINAYLKNIEYASNLYESLKLGQLEFDSLKEDEVKELIVFCNHLRTLYNNSLKAKQKNETFVSSGSVLNDILELSKKISPDGTLDYHLADRVIRMFCGFAGIDTLEQAKDYIQKKVIAADARNRNVSNLDMVLEQGDFVKGIGDITYLKNILQNGSVSKEYLGSSSDSDVTPLDTDVSMILSSAGTIREKMAATSASGYGPIWFVLKNDDRFVTTRASHEVLDSKRDMSKIEVFYTGGLGYDHYGIRTGFASSEINYIVLDSYDPRVGLEIAMNGFYIPVVNKEGKIIFAPKDYDLLRRQMSGLSYFGEENYSFSENLITKETESLALQMEYSNYEVQVKRQKINNIIKKSLLELGLQLKTNIDGDLTEGIVELIDTGSTGRGTNMPGDGDFDFIMRLDKTILSNSSRLNHLKQILLKNLGKESFAELTKSGDFRLKSVQIDAETSVDIDITFVEKTDQVAYSTDMALKDRLATIQRIDSEKYKYVIANILLAKQLLKKAEVYKSSHGELSQGGLGGVGIENWILQNGGSFIDAAKNFIEVADGKSFSEFQSCYQIWDFGDNHLAERKGQYSHNNFVADNMNEIGYHKMVQVLKEYLKTMEIVQIETEEIKR